MVSWKGTGVATTFFAALTRCSCLNLSTFEAHKSQPPYHVHRLLLHLRVRLCICFHSRTHNSSYSRTRRRGSVQKTCRDMSEVINLRHPKSNLLIILSPFQDQLSIVNKLIEAALDDSYLQNIYSISYVMP
ncbi:hypothetical protein SLA2020_046640 [Shorea laevis]